MQPREITPTSDSQPSAPAGGWARRRWAALPIGARWVVAAAAVLAFALAFQGSRPLWEPDEGRYAAVAVHMNRSGDHLVPRLHHEYPHFTKPPLTYWSIAAAMEAVGESEWALRLPNALAFAATALLVYGIGRRLCPDQAVLAATVYATFLLPTVAANIANSDTLLTAFEALAVWGFASWWWGADRSRRGWLVVMWLGFGLAFLTKGPPGLMPLLGIVALVAAAGGARGLAALFPPAGVCLFAVVGFSWYVSVVIRRPELIGYFLGEEIVGRVFSDIHGRNAEWYGPVTVYVPALLLGALPWTAVLLGWLRHAGHALRPSWWRRWLRDDPALFFTLAWLLSSLLVFVISRSRLQLYVLPLFVALAVLTAMALRGRWQWTRRRLALLAVWLAVLVGLRAGVAHFPTDRDARAWAREVQAVAHRDSFDEIVMVGVRNGYGLGFYLDCEVEHVAFTVAEVDRIRAHRHQTVEEELAEDERQLFLVDSRRAHLFEEIVRGLGRTPRLEGRVRGASVYFFPR